MRSVDSGIQSDAQHVGLPTACAEVYAAITGSVLDPKVPAQTQEVLNDVARAMTYVIRIYAADARGVREIGGFDALQGNFVRGAQAFQRRCGEEIGGLAVQRRDMKRVIEVLRSARVRFRSVSSA